MCPQLSTKFPAFYEIRRLATKFATARRLSLGPATLIQSTFCHVIIFRFILILSCHLGMFFGRCLPFMLSHQNFLFVSCLFPAFWTTHQSSPPTLDHHLITTWSPRLFTLQFPPASFCFVRLRPIFHPTPTPRIMFSVHWFVYTSLSTSLTKRRHPL